MKKDWRKELAEAFAKAKQTTVTDGKTFIWSEDAGDMTDEEMRTFLMELSGVTEEDLEKGRQTTARLLADSMRHDKLPFPFSGMSKEEVTEYNKRIDEKMNEVLRQAGIETGETK